MNPIKDLNREKTFTVYFSLFMGGFCIFISIVTIFSFGLHFKSILFFIVGIVLILFSKAMNKHYEERRIALLNAIEAGMYKDVNRKKSK